MEKNKEIAGTILKQLGGGRFIAMTGAKRFFCDENGRIGFSIGRNCKNINYVKVYYNVGMDLYNMKFEQVRMSRKTYNVTRKMIAKFEGLYSISFNQYLPKRQEWKQAFKSLLEPLPAALNDDLKTKRKVELASWND